MEYNGFDLEVAEVSRLVFNRETNIFSTPVITSFIRAFELLKDTEEVKVLVITGTGRTFLAGADIKEMSAMSETQARAFAEHIHSAMNSVEELERPVIAAVNGFALGGGCELALACDLVIASESAVFGQPEIDLGIIPGAGGTQRLKARIGVLKAKELIFTGRRVSANEALEIGLVNKVVPAEKLSEESTALARAIASKPAQCLQEAKWLLNSGSLIDEIDSFVKLFGFEDRSKLMSDFLSKRR